MTALKFTLERKEVEVVLEAADGTEKNYKLIELSGAQRNTYLNSMKDRAKSDKTGNITITSFDGLQASLLVLCLYDENGENAKKDFIESMPASTQQSLFEEAQKLSGLDNKEESTDTEKNA